MHYAIYSGKVEVLKMLTHGNFDLVKMQDHAGRTALHHAVFMENNQVLMCQKLIDLGSDVNALDQDKRTPLHHAAEAGKARVIPILMKNGAIVSLRDGHTNKTPIELAASDKIRELIIAYSNVEIDFEDWQNKKDDAKKSKSKKDEKSQKEDLFTFGKDKKAKAEKDVADQMKTLPEEPMKDSAPEVIEKAPTT